MSNIKNHKLNNDRSRLLKNDLFYELRMLLASTKIIAYLEDKAIGNVINFYKDSAYLHVRNLYNFFSGSASNDSSVQSFTVHKFDISLYKKWKDPLHNHVVHIKYLRMKPSNIIDGVHLNQMVSSFSNDIEKLWNEWVKNTEDEKIKILLIDTLNKAKAQSEDDLNFVKELIK